MNEQTGDRQSQGARRPVAQIAARLVIVVTLGIVFALVAYAVIDAPTRIYYYRVVDEHTLLLGTESGPGANVQVTKVVETPDTVTITVSGFFLQLGPSTDEGYAYESAATLTEPLGGRTVIDGSNGLSVQRANCPPPSYFATVCP